MKSSFDDGSLLGNKQERGHMFKTYRLTPVKSLTHWVAIKTSNQETTALIGYPSEESARVMAAEVNARETEGLSAVVVTNLTGRATIALTGPQGV